MISCFSAMAKLSVHQFPPPRSFDRSEATNGTAAHHKAYAVGASVSRAVAASADSADERAFTRVLANPPASGLVDARLKLPKLLLRATFI